MYINKTRIVDNDCMIDSISIIREIKHRTEVELKKLLQDYPEYTNVSLHCHVGKNSDYYSIRWKQDDKLLDKYISDRKQISILYRIKYYRKIIKYTSAYIDNIPNKRALEAAKRLENCMNNFNPEFSEGVPRELLSNRICAEIWAEENYRSNPYAKEKCIYTTKKGDKVRSKAEMFIADLLYDMDLPYRYESELVLKNGKTIYPDFTIMDSETGRLYYLEYFGLMDVEEYVVSNIKRLKEYADNGITFGNNLLAAFESSRATFDPAAIRRMIQNVFSGR